MSETHGKNAELVTDLFICPLGDFAQLIVSAHVIALPLDAPLSR